MRKDWLVDLLVTLLFATGVLLICEWKLPYGIAFAFYILYRPDRPSGASR